MTRVVFDTNVIVSAALLRRSAPGRAFLCALRQGTVLVSAPSLRKLTAVLRRAKFDRYVSREERDELLKALVRESRLVEITEFVRECRDPDDDGILEVAVNGDAEYLVTGDEDLLRMDPFRGVRIVTPAEFLAVRA